MGNTWCRIGFALLALVPLHAYSADTVVDGSCEFRTSEIYPIRSIAGLPKAGSRVKVEILFDHTDQTAKRKSQVMLTADGAVCRSPNPALKPEDRGWIEIGVGKKLTDLRMVKQLHGFDGFRVTVVPSAEHAAQ